MAFAFFWLSRHCVRYRTLGQRAAGERWTSSYWRIFWLNSKQHVIVRQNSSEKKNAGNLTSVQESKIAVNSFC